MTAMIEPLVPAPRPLPPLGPTAGPSWPRRPLPLAFVPERRVCPIAYGMSAMDDRGRISDRVLTGALGWTPGTALTATTASDGVVVVCPDGDGRLRVTPGGSFRLPAAIRHRVQLRPGERLLLVADPDQEELRLYPPKTLDLLLRHRDSEGRP